MDVLIRARGLKRTYYRALVEVNALKGVDLDIRKGEFVAIMGPLWFGKIDAYEPARLSGQTHRRRI